MRQIAQLSIGSMLALLLTSISYAADTKSPADPADAQREGSVVPARKKGTVSNAGSLDKAQIEAVLRTRKEQIKGCYDRRVARDNTIKGKVVVRFVIAPSGDVSYVEVLSNDTGSKGLGDCIAQTIAPLKYPKPRGGGEVIVTYPYKFSLWGPTFWDWLAEKCS